MNGKRKQLFMIVLLFIMLGINCITLNASGEYNLPATYDEYATLYNGGAGRTEFYISTPEDFINAQTLCADSRVDGFSGVTIIIANSDSATGIWDICSITDFSGIGTEECPFKGTIYCYFKSNGGVVFETDKPLIAYAGDGADIHGFNFVLSDACAAVAGNISGTVTISDIVVSGNIVNSEGAAGSVAATVADDAEVNITDFSSAADVSGVNAGGIAGVIGDNVSIVLGENINIGTAGNKITVSGTVTTGGYAGNIIGNHTINIADFSAKVNVSSVSNAGEATVGHLVGKMTQSGSGEGILTLTGAKSIEVDVSGTGSGGGLIGVCSEGTELAVPEGGFTVSGTVEVTGRAGGILGISSYTAMELADFTIEASVSGLYAGGICGQMYSGKYIIENVTVNGTVTGATYTGGIIGRLSQKVAIELQGSIAINGTVGGGNDSNGRVIGANDMESSTGISFVYFAGVEGKVNDTKQLIGDGALNIREVGNVGGIFRNQDMGSGTVLIGDGTLANVGVINNTVTKAGDYYQLTNVADFECLAIMLATDGQFAGNAFGDGVTYSDLLVAKYEVTANVDISYDKTGIIALNRNDKQDAAYAFAGEVRGTNTSITITQNMTADTVGATAKHLRTGLFSTIGNASFSNLVITGEIDSARGSGGLAYQSIGTILNLENIRVEKNFSRIDGKIGGVLAQKYCVTCKSYECTCENYLVVTGENLELACNIDAGVNGEYSGFITDATYINFDLDTIIIGGNITSTNTVNDAVVGGFMGRIWHRCYGKIKNVRVESGTSFNVANEFGGIANAVTTPAKERLIIEDVALNNLTINANADAGLSALLFLDGKDIVLDLIDYDTTGCVVNNPGSKFDEIVGKVTYSDGSVGGIVSIHKTGTKFPDYHYENKATNLTSGKRNNRNRYFYDVFQTLEDSSGNVLVQISADNVLDTPEKVLLWNVVHYASEGSVRNTFAKYYASGGHSFDGENYKFSGNLDLSGVSIYPIENTNGTYSGINNATITFAAKTNDVDMSTWQISNTDSNSQHYMLHAGLFKNPVNLAVSDITLTGTIANLGASSGALVCGNSAFSGGSGTFTDITLNDLWVANYNKEAYVGLMVSVIPNATATFSGIKMTGYPTETATKAAAALIGSAGSDDATELKLSFSEMVIADDADGRSEGSHNGQALAYASFLYNYDYTDTASINEGFGLYLFSEADDAGGIVTYGKELDMETEFSDTTNKVFSGSDPVPSTVFKPYVYQSKQIEVNPKSGDILKGCGTYEDPYIIENEKQFLTLYRYMNETGTEGNYQYQSFYQNWKVIKCGDDSSFCSDKHNVTWTMSDGAIIYAGTGKDDARTFGEAGFPTPDEMSRAYYRLESNIDLSKDMSATYNQIAQDFVGFGIETRPFVGVWYGKGSDDSVHEVTLPNKDGTQSQYQTYGFIQYAKGAVIKDIVIKTYMDGASSAPEKSKTAVVNSVGGGVIATILGGDNIIDGVTVKVDYYTGDSETIVGGYVGVVKKGGLILRNVTETSLVNFRLYWDSNSSSRLLGAVVGKVEDGYVVYEGDGAGSYLWDGKGGNTVFEQIPNYRIINADKLAEANVSVLLSDGMTTFAINNAAGMQALEMALNSDSLNVRPSSYTAYSACGYTEASRCRKAAYDSIGCDTAVADYVKAASYDNVMNYGGDADSAYAYPYLYKYLGISNGDYTDYLVGGYTILNPSQKINSSVYRVLWQLAENGMYDLSVYGKSFRGYGAIYQTGNGNGGTFHGSFDGNGSTINVALEREALATNQEIYRVGLFNTIYGNDDAMYNVAADFTEPDSNGTIEKNCFEIKDFTISGSVNVTKGSTGWHTCVGAVAAYVNSARYIFSGINCNAFVFGNIDDLDKNNNITPIEFTGGVVAFINKNSYVMINDCNFSGTPQNPLLYVYCGSTAAGGLVGVVESNSVLKVVSSTVSNILIKNTVVLKNGLTGGMIGYCNGNATLIGTDSKPIRVENCTITAHSDVGGVAGYVHGYINVCKAVISGNTIGAYNNIGGLIGRLDRMYYTATPADIIRDVTVTDFVVNEIHAYDGQASGIGGIVGRNQRSLLLENVTVSGTVNNGIYSSRITAANDKARTAQNSVGGLVGRHEDYILEINDCNTHGLYIKTDIRETSNKTTYDLSAGGLVGSVLSVVALSGDVYAENNYIEAPLKSESNITVVAAGGCFGIVLENGTVGAVVDENLEYYEGLKSIGNTVSGKYAGGMFGYVGVTQDKYTNIRLKKIVVKDGSVDSDCAAGGVFGEILPGYTGIAVEAGTTDNSEGTFDNVISNMQITGTVAGGIAGSAVIVGPLRLENFTVKNNIIKSKQYSEGANCAVGGIIGQNSATSTNITSIYNIKLTGNRIVAEVAGDTLLATEIDKLAVGGILGRTIANGSLNTGELRFDGISLATDNIIGVATTVLPDDVKLIKKSGEEYVLATAELPAVSGSLGKDYLALENIIEQYGYFVGVYAGIIGAENVQVYILNTTQDMPMPVMTDNAPVVNVGRTSTASKNAHLTNCHIISGAAPGVSEMSGSNLIDMKAEVDKLNSEYSGTESLTDLIVRYNLDENAVNTFLAMYKNSYGYAEGYEIDFPILVYKVENGDLQDVLETIADIMTNMAGSSSADIDESYLTISAAAKEYDGTAVTNGTSASISVSITDGIATFTSEKYDGLSEDGTKLTYTELTFTYGWANDHKRIFVIPVFVEEPILYTVHTKLTEGRVQSVDEVKNKGVTEDVASVMMANDSDYTMLLEFTYSKARKDMPDGAKVDKEFYLEATGMAKPLPIGTKLLLVDVTNGNKPYYYTVESANLKTLKFSEFTDMSGNSYVNSDINDLADEVDLGKNYYTDLAGHKLTEAGVERYLLTVLSADNTNGVYSINTGLCIDESIKSRFVPEEGHEEKITIGVRAIPGLKISLDGKGTNTDISGAMSKEDSITVKARIKIEAEDDIYWVTKANGSSDVPMIDSLNSGKYLELAFYLRDSGENRVKLPDGTNFSYKQGNGDYSENKVIPDTSIFYYYKDIRSEFVDPESKYQMSTIADNTTVDVEFNLNFAGADFGNTEETSYIAWLQLLRTANMDYPMGNGNELDEYSETISVNGLQQFGFAIRAKDLSALAINTYPIATNNEIPCSVMFDFSEILTLTGGIGKEQVLAKWAGYDYEITYTLHKKVNTGGDPVYEEYTGNDIVITANGDTSVNGTLITTYNFTADEIGDGNGDNPVPGVLALDCDLRLNTASMDENSINLTNYKLEAKLTVKQTGLGGGGSKVEETTDFIIFTLTRLKTDI